MRLLRNLAHAAVLGGLLAGCASIDNQPLNRPLTGEMANALSVGAEGASYSDDLMIGLAFSGGGTRAAAFSYGVLAEIDRVRLSGRGVTSLLDRVDFVSGVSGGSVLAAYFGLKKRA